MNKRLVFDWTKAHDVVSMERVLGEQLPSLQQARSDVLTKNQANGWIRFPSHEAAELIPRIKECSSRVAAVSNAVVILGVGGSYLGARAVYEALTHSYAPYLGGKKPVIFWAGYHLATDEINELLDVLDKVVPSVIVISKSGTTTETALVFRLIKKYMDDRFGEEESNERTITITDPEKGVLHDLTQKHGYSTFQVPQNIGGRYSVFTAVGLLPLCLAGVDIEEFVAGACSAFDDLFHEGNQSLETNPGLCYAAARNYLYTQNFKVESLCVWSPKFRNISEWWKQLFGESDGKAKSGIFPASVVLTADLHSMGQYFQEGERHLFATHVTLKQEYSVGKTSQIRTLSIPDASFDDGFSHLKGRPLQDIQSAAQQGTFLAHSDGGVPTLVWELPEANAFWWGYWMYTNMFACSVGNLARGVNPFDQPGVEAYKQNMFALLGKPGFSDKQKEILMRLERSRRLVSLGVHSK